MPAGKGKPAGGYHAGAKGSYGCDGYPTVSADGTVHGCHPTKARAAAQARAIWASTAKKFVTNVEKAMITEGDFVMFMEEDEIMVGRVQHVMSEGMLGLSDSEYAIMATSEDPALLVRCYEEEDGAWEEESMMHGIKSSEAVKIDSLKVSVDVIREMASSSGPAVDSAPEPVDAYYNSIGKRERSMATREHLAETGAAMPDGSYPIMTEADLRNAIQSVGRAKNYAAAKQHIITRARALGLTELLPQDWKNSAQKGMTGWGGSVFDLHPFVK